MNNPMLERKVTKFKTAGIGAAVTLALIGGGYALGDGHVFNVQPAAAISPTTSTPSPSSTPVNTDAAMVVSAVEYYQTQHGVTADSSRVEQLQVQSAWARGKLDNGDSGSVFYAHEVQGVWTVVFSGQTPLTQAVADQYNFPSEWVGEANWYN